MKKNALNEKDLNLIAKYLTGGAAIGGGAALITSLLNHLNDIKEENKNPLEDHTLKLIVKNPEDQQNKKIASSDEQSASFFRAPLAMTGGLLSTIGSYALVRHLYQKIKEQQLKKELQEAQDKYVSNLEDINALAKNANSEQSPGGKPISYLEALTSAPLAASLLLALGSGVVSYQTLKKSFPNLKRKSREALGPKRVQVVYDKPGTENDEVLTTIPLADLEKQATANAFLINTVIGFGGESDVADVVKMAASGNTDYLNLVFATDGIESVLTKCANYTPEVNNIYALNLASNWCARNPALSSSLSVLAASEFAEKAPLFFKSAMALEEPVQNALVDFVIKAHCKVANEVIDKIKEVELDPELIGKTEENETQLNSEQDKLDAQELLELLLKAKTEPEMEFDQIPDLQSEDSEEARQE